MIAKQKTVKKYMFKTRLYSFLEFRIEVTAIAKLQSTSGLDQIIGQDQVFDTESHYT